MSREEAIKSGGEAFITGVERFSPLGTIILPQHELHGITTTDQKGRLGRLPSLNRDILLDRIVSNAFGGRMNDGTPFEIRRESDSLVYVISGQSISIGDCTRDPDGKTRIHNLNHKPFVDAGFIHYCPAGGWGETDVVTMAVRNHGSMHPLGIHDFNEGERSHFFQDTAEILKVTTEQNGQALWGICHSAGSLDGPQSVHWLHGHSARVAEPLATTSFEGILSARRLQQWDGGLTKGLLEERFEEFRAAVRVLNNSAEASIDPTGVAALLHGVTPDLMKSETFAQFWDFLSFGYMYTALEAFHDRHYEGSYRDCVLNLNGGNGNGLVDLDKQLMLITPKPVDELPSEREIINQLRKEGIITEPMGWAASILFRDNDALLSVITTPFKNLGGIEATMHKLQRMPEPLSAFETAQRYEPIARLFSQ